MYDAGHDVTVNPGLRLNTPSNLVDLVLVDNSIIEVFVSTDPDSVIVHVFVEMAPPPRDTFLIVCHGQYVDLVHAQDTVYHDKFGGGGNQKPRDFPGRTCPVAFISVVPRDAHTVVFRIPVGFSRLALDT